jgi:UDP-N-acetylglucosamine 2-epimerase (non-hydrolysing)
VKRVLFVFGTRPEAIKLCPLVLSLARQPDVFQVQVCVTGQHRSMLDQVLEVFGVTPDYDLNVMQAGQSLTGLTARILAALEPVLQDAIPDMMLVQGDTTTTMTAALAAFYQGIPVGHVEAGLRTGDLRQPFPEEMNRVITGRLATLHFAPTARSAAVLRAEGVPSDHIFLTGNTGIDAVLYVRERLEAGTMDGGAIPGLDSSRKLVLVTSHRRESFGAGFESSMRALRRLADRGDVQIVYPVHRNPNVVGPAHELLGGHPHILLIEPLSYVQFVELMRRSWMIISDSGGVQEEAPSLGRPVLVLREKTERPEAVEAGTVKLVGTNEELIVAEAVRLLDDPGEYGRMTRVHNPYGDGHACRRIAEAIVSYFDGLLFGRPQRL